MPALALVALLLAAGCAQPSGDGGDGVVDASHGWTRTDALRFEESIVTPAVGSTLDLFEPMVEVSDRGTIYVAGHTMGALVTGTPAYVSRDDGASWAPLPFLGPAATPSPGQGASPPPGAEGYIVAGDDDRAWMVDVNLAALPVTGWCDDGATQCMYNPDAFDRAASASCAPQSVNDRAWVAYANGTLLLVNNPNTGHAQVGVLGPDQVTPGTWNACAAPGGNIAGPPALRADGWFVVPQRRASELAAVVGRVDDLPGARQVKVADLGNLFAGMDSNAGRAAIDGDGHLFMAVINNSARGGGVLVAASRDDAASFSTLRLPTEALVGWMHLDSSPHVRGAFLSWTQQGAGGTWDFHAGHVRVDDAGVRLDDVSLVVAGVVGPYGDLLGNAVGPDGRGYVAVYTNPGTLDYPGTNPVRVWIQRAGPTLSAADA